MEMLILHTVFEGQITKYCKLQAKMFAGSLAGSVDCPQCTQGPVYNTVRTPTDKSVWGTIPNKVHIEMKLKA